MNSPQAEAHSRAVASLQARLSTYRPGSFPYRIAERALDLAFNGARALDAASEQTLLAEAESLISRQVQAKLLSSPAEAPTPSPSPHDSARIRYLAWRGTLRPHAAQQFLQAELWLTTEGHRQESHALLS